MSSSIFEVAAECGDELRVATRKFPPMTSAHEGWAILREEVDELWDEVKKRPALRSTAAMRHEAIQVAAMAMRFVIDVCDRPETPAAEGEAE